MKRPNGGPFFVLYEVGYTARFTKRKRGIMRRHYWYRTPLRWRAAGAALLWHGPMFSHSLTGGRLTKVVRNVIHSEIESGECDK